MMRKGYTLPEVMVGLLIGALLSGILFESLSQINQIFARVVATSSLERQVALMQQQFENDFSGMFSPRLVEIDEADTEKKDDAETQKPQQKEPGKDSKDTEESVFKSFVFEGTTQGLVNIMTFVTTNPLLSYRQPAPRVVRVAYRVIPDPENEGKLLLIRQQSDELSLKKFELATKKETIKSDQKLIRSYEIARALESIKFEFFIEKIKKAETATKQPAVSDKDKKDKKDEKKEQEEEQPRAFVLIEEWLKLSEEERAKFEAPEIPAFIHITIGMNDERKHVRTFECWFAPCYGTAPVLLKGITSDLPSKDELRQRELADEHTQRMNMHNDAPQKGR